MISVDFGGRSCVGGWSFCSGDEVEMNHREERQSHNSAEMLHRSMKAVIIVV